MREKLYTIISSILILTIIFVIPTSTMLDKIIQSIFKINNIYLVFLIKLLVYLIILLFINRYKYKGFSKHRLIQFIGKNAPFCIGVALIIAEIVITVVLKYQDSMGYIEIKAETWLSYLSGMIATALTAFGLLITLNQYISSKAEKERPRIALKFAEKNDKAKYRVAINENNYTRKNKLFRYAYIKLENKGENNIYNLKVEEINFNRTIIKPIVKESWGYGCLDEIDGKNNSKKEKNEIIQLQLFFEEGMNPERTFMFYLVYECCGKLYKNLIKITTERVTQDMIKEKNEKMKELKVGDTERIYLGGKKYGEGKII